MLFDFSRQPYLDADTGADMGGGNADTGTNEQQTDTGAAETTGGDGTQQAQQTQTEQPKFKVKYNHEERELTMEEAIQYAQKGMNYDHVHSELEQLRNHPGAAWLQAQAKRYGMSVEQLIEAYQQQEEQEQLNQLVQQNIPQEYAKEMLENRKFREQYQAREKAREEADRKAKEERELTSRRNSMYEEFMTEFPDYNTEEKWKTIPPEVYVEADKWLKSGGAGKGAGWPMR